MRKLLIIPVLILSLGIYAQEEEKVSIDFPKNEFRINALNLLLFKSFDISYERAINKESSVGINTMFSLEGKSRFTADHYIYYYEGFTLTPYYRLYFGKKPNAGFFGEAFAVLASGKYEYYGSDYASCAGCLSVGGYGYSFRDFTAFGVGLSFGVKLIKKPNFVTTIHGGAARNFLNSKYDPGITPRVGISFGWRY